MPRLHVNLLGAFRANLDGDPVTGFDSDKVRALLAYLAVETERPHRREKLAGLLWPDYPERSARTSLRSALTNLRTVIGDRDADPPYLNITRQTIQFNLASDHQIDVADFTRLASGEPGEIERAIELYRGDFLEGFSIPDSASFEDWLVVTRQSLRRRAVDALQILARHYESQGDHEAALGYARRAGEMEPYDEDAQRLIMRVLAEAGQRTQAIASYEAFKGLLADELGTEPSEETRNLAEGIDQGVFEPSAPGIGKLRGYELRELLGEGHFGAVYRAYQGAVGRDVAIKVILPRFADDPEFIRSFESEAQLVARLEHPHVVPLYDYWREPGGAYLVMRWLRGGSLKSALERGPWSGDAALQLVDQVALALAAAHRQGIVHRDIKPANILLDEVGNAYLSDFGIATLTGPLAELRDKRSTEAERSASSMDYLSPELAAGAEPAPSADIYSFGVTIYELLTGESPYSDLEGEALLEVHRNQPLPSVHAQRPELPLAVDEVVRKATSKDPAERYGDPLQLAGAFQTALTGVEPVVIAHPAEITNPYKGLRAFQETDAGDFYGRERMVARLLERLTGDLEGSRDGQRKGDGRFLAVVGPSGSGKSSLVKAGLLPALRRGAVDGSEDWFITEMTPGARPFEELEAAILRVAVPSTVHWTVNPPEKLLAQLKEDDRGIARAVKRALPPGDETDLLLVVDQFEELFTIADPPEARAFLDALYAAVIDPESRLQVVITLRADFYDRPLMIPDFSELVRERTEAVTPMSAGELAQAIEAPARNTGVGFEEGLVARLVAEVHEQVGALPLLQYALTELFERRQDGKLTLAAYEAMGGVSGALGRRAEELYNELDAPGQAAARQVFLRLVTLGEGVEDTRRRVLRSELEALVGDQRLSPGVTQAQVPAHEAPIADNGLETSVRPPSTVHRPPSTVRRPPSTVHRPSSPLHRPPPTVQSVLNLYGRHRLLTFDRDEESRAPTVEVAHEALLREWRRLAEWLEQSRADVRMQRVLSNLAADWEASGRDPSFLLRGSRLDQYEAWGEVTDLALTIEEEAYLETSLAERRLREAEEAARQEHERALERRSIRRLRVIVAVLVVASVVGILLTLAVFNQSRIAQQSEALANQNAATATVAKGLAEFQAATAQAERARAEGEADARATQKAIAESEADARATQQAIAEFNEAQARGQALAASSRLALNAGETDLALALALEAIQVEDPPLQAELALADAAYSPGTRHVLRGHIASNVYNLSFSPDGRQALSGAIDRTVVLWDLESGEPLGRYGGYRGSVTSVNYFPDGNTAILGMLDNSARLLDLETGDELGRFLHRPPFVAAELSPDGREALWVDQAGRLVLLDIEGGELIQTFGSPPNPEEGFSQAVSALAFHPDGVHALSGHVDGGVTLWDLETGNQVRAFGEEPAAIEELVLIPDGSGLLSANANGEVVLWDLDAGQERWRYQPSSIEDQVYRFAFLPNKAQVLFGASDGGLILWDLDSGEQIARLGGGGSTQGHAGWVSALAISSDGLRAVSGGTHGRLILWDLESGQEIHRFDEADSVSRRSPVLSLDLSGDGNQALVGYENGTLKLWDLRSGELLQSYNGNFWNVEGVALFPAGQSALVSTIDGGLHRWDFVAGRFERLFDGLIAGWVEVTLSQDGRLALSLVSDIIHITDLTEAGHPEDLLLWDLETRQLLQRLSGVHEAAVVDAALSPDGRWALSGDAQGGLVLWDLDNGGAVYTIPSDGHYVLDIAFNADGNRALTSSSDDEDGIVLWDVSTGDVLGNFPVVLNGESLAFSPDGSMAYAGLSNGEIQVWDTETGQEVDLLAGHTNIIYDLDLSADGRTAISAAEDGVIRVWNLNLGPQIGTLVSPGYQFGLAISPDGERALTGADGGLLEWDLESDQLIRKLEGGHEQPVFDIVISPDGRQAVSSGGDPFAEDRGSLALWDLGTGSVVRRLDWETQIYHLAITPDGRYAVVTSNFTDEFPGVFLWDLESGEVVERFQIENTENISAVALSPDGSRVLTGVLDRVEGDWVRLWDLEEGELLESFPGHETAAIDMAFLPDGERAVSVSWDRSLILWDIESAEMVRRMSGQNTELFSVAVDPSGRYALTGTGDGKLILWDLESGEAIRNYTAHSAPVAHIAFIAQWDLALTSALDGEVHIWRVHRTLDELVSWVHENRYVRQLTCPERDLYQVEPLCD